MIKVLGTTVVTERLNQPRSKVKLSAKNLPALFADVRSMIFGATIFTLILAWMRSSSVLFPENVFISMLLLPACILMLMNKRWSNLITVVLSGFMPLEILRQFLMLPMLAEVRMFSSEHFRYFFGPGRLTTGFLMLMVVTTTMLVSSSSSILRNAK